MPKVNQPPNGERFISSTPMISSVSKTFPDADLPAVSHNHMDKKPILELVIEAVEAVGVKRKGASYQAIKKYVQNARESDAPRLINQLKLTLQKGIDQGVLVRPNISKNVIGVNGFYLLSKKQPPRGKLGGKSEVIVKKPKKPKSSELAVSDSEVTDKKKPLKIPKKLNLSDRALSELEQMTEPEGKLASKHKPKENLDTKQKSKPKIQTKEPNKAKTEVTASKKPKVTKDTVKPERKKIPKIKNERKDLSDSEMVVKKPNRKSLKSYSSDTEVNNMETTKPKRNAPKEIAAKAAKKTKAKAGEVPPPLNHTTAKVMTGRKLYDKSAEPMQTDAKEVKKARTRNKKETS